MTDFASELAKVFSNGCSPANTDWNAPRYFDSLNNPCYEKEAALMSSLTSEAYNQFGFEVEYFIKKISTNADKVYGEDQLENFERRFKLHVYAESIPAMQRIYELQGINYDELVELDATIQHFREASQIDFIKGQPLWNSVSPKIGDVMYFPWCDLYYEILNVKDFADGSTFLSSSITYHFTLRVWRNSHESVDLTDVNPDPMEHLQSYVSLAETFNAEMKTDANSFEHITEPTATSAAALPTSKILSSGDALAINSKTTDKAQIEDRLWRNDKRGEKQIDPWAGW